MDTTLRAIQWTLVLMPYVLFCLFGPPLWIIASALKKIANRTPND